MKENTHHTFTVGLLLIIFVATLTSTIIIPALPSLIRSLGGSQISLIWIVTSQLLAMTISLPLWGKLSDVYPQKRKLMLQISAACFLVASIIAGLSSSIIMLDIGRVIQGIGAGGVIALGQMIVVQHPSDKIISWLSISVGIAALSGPLLGGIIVEQFSWRWVFLLPILPGIIGLLCLNHFPITKEVSDKSFPFISSVLFTISVSIFIIWISLAQHSYLWLSLTSYLLFACFLISFLLWLWRESKTVNKIFPYAQLRSHIVLLFVNIGIGVILFCSIMFLSQFLQLAKFFTPVQVGVYTLPVLLGLVVAVLFAEKSKFSAQSSIVFGAIITTLSLYLLSFSLKDNIGMFIAITVFLGIGMGFIIQTSVSLFQNTHETSLSSRLSTVTFIRALAGTISIAILGNILNNQVLQGLQLQLEKVGVQLALSSKDKIPNFNLFPAQYKLVIEHVYTSSVDNIFIYLAVFSMCVLLIPSIYLYKKSLKEK